MYDGDDWKVLPDNVLLTAHGEELTRDRFEEALTQLRQDGLWQDESFWHNVARTLPNFRLSKFQSLMPPWVEREVVARYLLDVEGARTWLATNTLDVD